MPFFRFPFQYNPYYYSKYQSNYNSNISHKEEQNKTINPKIQKSSSYKQKKKNNSEGNNENYLFELFGLKLYIDDVIIISLLFFLYQEGVKDDELFISLILLLLT